MFLCLFSVIFVATLTFLLVGYHLYLTKVEYDRKFLINKENHISATALQALFNRLQNELDNLEQLRAEVQTVKSIVALKNR